MDKGSLLTISEASHILGVSEAALRQWTDEGKIKAFITPGGHRRYSKGELLKLTGIHRRGHGIKEMVERMELTPSLHLQIAQERFAQTSWYRELDIDSRRQLAEFGRKILNLTIAYITKHKQRDEILELARELGHDIGRQLAKLGLSLTDSLEAFLWHRAPVVNVIAELTKGGGTLSDGVVGVIPLVNRLLDEILLSLIKAYQDYQEEGDI
jgi:excisionase family DNA binding protein